MIRSKKVFTIGSLISMALMVAVLIIGATVKEGYILTYYGSRPYHRYVAFADDLSAWYMLFAAAMAETIAFGIISIALYNKRIKAINIINLICTSSMYVLALLTAIIAFSESYNVFGYAICFGFDIAFTLQLAVEIFALIAQRSKVEKNKPVRPNLQHVSCVPKSADSNNAIAMLKRLKELYDEGVLTEEEYSAKKKQYIDRL